MLIRLLRLFWLIRLVRLIRFIKLFMYTFLEYYLALYEILTLDMHMMIIMINKGRSDECPFMRGLLIYQGRVIVWLSRGYGKNFIKNWSQMNNVKSPLFLRAIKLKVDDHEIA